MLKEVELKLSLGTVQFGVDYGVANQNGQVSLDDASSIIEFSRVCGINTIDTAVGYGQSEQRLGEIGVCDFDIVSKLPGIPDGCNDVRQWALDVAIESLRRLKVDRLHGFLLHKPQELLGRDGKELYSALLQLKDEGLVEKIGISVYEPAELDVLCTRFKIDQVQAPFSLVDRRMIDTGWMARLSDSETELHVRSVFLQGLLLMNPQDRPHKFRHWASCLAVYDNWLEQRHLDPLSACLGYPLSLEEVDKVVVGVDSLGHLKEIVSAAHTGYDDGYPAELAISDPVLINPARWTELS
ncbi:aldo/keto reductase [Pseudomonadota bacterium]